MIFFNFWVGPEDDLGMVEAWLGGGWGVVRPMIPPLEGSIDFDRGNMLGSVSGGVYPPLLLLQYWGGLPPSGGKCVLLLLRGGVTPPVRVLELLLRCLGLTPPATSLPCYCCESRLAHAYGQNWSDRARMSIITQIPIISTQIPINATQIPIISTQIPINATQIPII